VILVVTPPNFSVEWIKDEEAVSDSSYATLCGVRERHHRTGLSERVLSGRTLFL